MSKRIFSGAQPTINLHTGNYLGALRNRVGLQHEYESFSGARAATVTKSCGASSARDATVKERARARDHASRLRAHGPDWSVKLDERKA